MFFIQYKFRKKLFLLVVLFFASCTFGSVGNKLKEDAIIINNLLKLLREIPVIFQPIVHSYDDQKDSNLANFEVSSGTGVNNKLYQVNILEENSFLEIEKLEFRFNPPEKVFGFFSVNSKFQEPVHKTHTPYTIPLDLPQNDLYGKTYISQGQKITSFMKKNSQGVGLGEVSKTLLSPITNAPAGILASVSLYLKRWDLNVKVQQISPPVLPPQDIRNLHISFQDYRLTFFPRCKIQLKPAELTEWILGINYSRLFRDAIVSNIKKETLNEIFQSTSSNPTEIILIFDVHSLYYLFFENLKAQDVVILQESCLL